jgi:hypothetical protein
MMQKLFELGTFARGVRVLIDKGSWVEGSMPQCQVALKAFFWLKGSNASDKTTHLSAFAAYSNFKDIAVSITLDEMHSIRVDAGVV